MDAPGATTVKRERDAVLTSRGRRDSNPRAACATATTGVRPL